MRGLVSLIVIFLCAVTAAGILQCGWQAGGRKCSDNSCCSSLGICGNSFSRCNGLLCQSLCWTGEGKASDVMAYFTFFNASQNGWNMKNVGCAREIGNKPFPWRSRYGWTAFCGPVGPQYPASCGKCLRVRNRATGTRLTVRIVESCNSGGFNLDYETFNQLDTNGKGMSVGYLKVDYVFVQCGDESAEEDDQDDVVNVALRSIVQDV